MASLQVWLISFPAKTFMRKVSEDYSFHLCGWIENFPVLFSTTESTLYLPLAIDMKQMKQNGVYNRMPLYLYGGKWLSNF